ncbi:MAG TPA: hypothetical protein VFG83_06350 [Kofleriaceae bacterium]|nr:hypothetical protein [Kofleriaceae bacterium]
MSRKLSLQPRAGAGALSRLAHTLSVDACVAAVGCVLVIGCVDPKARFDDFDDRVIDAPPKIEIDAPVVAEIPDVNGRFLLGLKTNLSDESFQFVAQVTLDEADGISMVLTPLDVDMRMPVGMMITAPPAAVSNTAQFDSAIGSVANPDEPCADPEDPGLARIPGDANPVSGSDLNVVAVAHGTIRSQDLFCGTVTGKAANLSCLDLGDLNATFAAIRLTDDAMGSSLPPPLGECPAGMPVDAGMPDAMPTPDAKLIDAQGDGDDAMPDGPMPDGGSGN